MRKFQKIFLSVIATGMVVSALRAEIVGKSIATVNGDAIFLSEYESNWDSLLEQQKKMYPNEPINGEWQSKSREALLDQMIDEKLLLQEAKRRKEVVPKRQLEEGILQVKNRFKNFPPGFKPAKEDYDRGLKPDENTQFIKELQKQGITEKEFESKIEDQLRVLRLTEEEIRGQVPIPFKDDGKTTEETDARELTSDYDSAARNLFSQIEKKFNDKNFKASPDNDIDQIVELLKSRLGESVHARHILIKTVRTDDFKKRQAALDKARAIKKQLDLGADFVDLAKQKSEGPSAQSGGDLGFFGRGQMAPEFEKAAFAIPVGSISEPIETEFGYHIIKVEEKRAAQRLRYEDVKMDLAGYLFQKKMKERYDQYVGDLRKKADIKILIDLKEIGKG